MKCPTCQDVRLAITDRQGIEIDYCPECRGVWLDRGELDKIIDRSSALETAQRSKEKKTEKYEHGPQGHYQQGKKRKGFLGELLDF